MKNIQKILTLIFIITVLISCNKPSIEKAEILIKAQKYDEAIKIIRPMAEEGFEKAQNHLGVRYNLGQGVTQDYKEAIKWYTKAAEQGLANAQFNLGGMYYLGQGVTQDYKEAIRWYTKAAEQGLADAQFNLGSIYRRGQGVTQDYVEAHKWINLSAVQNTKAIVDRNKIETEMTKAQIAKAQKLASEFVAKKEK